MTDERRPIRQISGNLQEFQPATSKLTDVTVKVVIYDALVESTRMSRKIGVTLWGWPSLFLLSFGTTIIEVAPPFAVFEGWAAQLSAQCSSVTASPLLLQLIFVRAQTSASQL